MRRSWLMIVLGTAACVSATRIEWDADAVRETDSDCATAKGTASCSESAASEQDAASGSAEGGRVAPWRPAQPALMWEPPARAPREAVST
jgi:hypothetical protein